MQTALKTARAIPNPTAKRNLFIIISMKRKGRAALPPDHKKLRLQHQREENQECQGKPHYPHDNHDQVLLSLLLVASLATPAKIPQLIEDLPLVLIVGVLR